MRTLGKLIVAGVVIFILLQAVRPEIPEQPATADLQAPPEVKHLLERSCYSCHSSQRRLSWFDQLVPGYWLVRHDILTAREHLNFSTLGSKPAAAQKATLYEAVNMIQLGTMPLPSFLKLHPDAKLTPEDLATLKAYLAPWSGAPSPANGAPAAAGNNGAALGVPPARLSLATVLPEFDGFPFDPAFENWKPISTTDRGDNNTFRFILGNDVAVEAARTGNIFPWPDGARFAKIAWQQEAGPDGLIYPGKFVQVELMLKDAQRYKDNEGWGWGRWRGMDLKPYGQNAQFVNECTGCHWPMRGNDYVYTLPISAAKTETKVNREEAVNNNAALLAALPYQALRSGSIAWCAITMYVDPKIRTTATLYGNDVAMQAVQASRAKSPAYPAGAVLALVTWGQRDDPHWFGARIPDQPQSVEFVQVGTNGQQNAYRRFAGSGQNEDLNFATAAQRTSFVLGLVPVQLP